MGQKPTWRPPKAMSALPLKADIGAAFPAALELFTRFDTGHICSTSSAAGFISAAVASRASPRGDRY